LLARSPEYPQGDAIPPNVLDEMIEVLHLALIRRGLAVARGSSYDSFDLRIIVAPYIRIGVLFLNSGRSVSLAWWTGAAGWRMAASLTALLILLLAGGFSIVTAVAICGLVSGAFAAVALRRASRVPAVICAASAELAERSKIGSHAEQQSQTPTRLGEAAN
jgi:hypothetical protein